MSFLPFVPGLDPGLSKHRVGTCPSAGPGRTGLGWPKALAALLALLLAVPVAAQTVQPPAPAPAPTLQTAADALAEDAAAYAKVSGLPVDEAARQLRAQRDTIPVTDALAAEFAGRLAGIAVAHQPHFAIEVLLTGDAPVAPRVTVGGGVVVPITFRTGAPATRMQLLAALTASQAAIRAALPRPPGMGVDPRTGTLIVSMGEGDLHGESPDGLASRLAAIAGVPVSLSLFDHKEKNLAIEGGARMVGEADDGHRYVCTAGFVVTDGVREGLVTAAHCPDHATYVSPDGTRTPLSFEGQWGWSFQDVQLHLAAAPLAAAIYADGGKTLLRPVTAARPRASTRAGDVVCHRGEWTGYSCAEVELTDFAPAGDLCGGPCAPSWVAVDGPACHGGDSGGPVFDGTVALGIVKGGSYKPDGTCAFWFYMAVDYLPAGWRVLTTTPTAPEGTITQR